MGHHNSRYRPPPPPPRGRYDGGYDAPDRRGYGPPRRIPFVVILGALLVWTLLAWGAWALVGPFLAWAGGMVAPVLDVGSAVGGAVGLGKEVGAVIEASRAEGIAQWLLGVLGWIARPAIVIIWIIGVGVILLARRLASWGGLSRLMH